MNHLNKINYQTPNSQELSQICSVSKILGESPFYKNLKESGVLAIWLTAREMGLPPMLCLNSGMWTYNGKVSMSSQLMNYMITSKGHRVDIVKLSEETCVLKFVRSDREGKHAEYIHTVNASDFQHLLHKDNWKHYRKDMLFNRCLASGARKFMADVIMQAYIHEEISDTDKEYSNELKKHHINLNPQNSDIELTAESVEHIETEESSDMTLEKFTEIHGQEKADYLLALQQTLGNSIEDLLEKVQNNLEGFNIAFESYQAKVKELNQSEPQ